jgi:HK97 family phage major capsid protein
MNPTRALKLDAEERNLVIEINQLLTDARALMNKPSFSKEDNARVDSYLKMAELLMPDSQRLFRNLNLAALERQSGIDAATHERVFRLYLTRGINGLEPQDKEILYRYRANWASAQVSQATSYASQGRAQGIATGAAGGFLAPLAFMDRVEESLKHFSAMRRVSTVVPTATGSDMGWPTVDDTANIGELLPENVATVEQDTPFAQIVFRSFKYSSKLIRVSVELLTDAAPNIEQVLASLFARRIGVLQNAHFTTGTGTGQPLGVLTTASLGKTGLAGQTATVIYDDFVDLLHSVDPLYRASESCVWQMHDSTLKIARKLKDSAGMPLLTSATQTDTTRDFILGFPVVVNPDLPVMAANAKSILFGDFSRYTIRDSLDFAVLRLSERYADSGQTGFISFMRSDGRMLDAGTDPVKFFQNSAT